MKNNPIKRPKGQRSPLFPPMSHPLRPNSISATNGSKPPKRDRSVSHSHDANDVPGRARLNLRKAPKLSRSDDNFYCLKRNPIGKESLGEISPGSATKTDRQTLNPPLKLPDRRWELAPILLAGQNVGWRVVKIL
jgi:hypothetical protein